MGEGWSDMMGILFKMTSDSKGTESHVIGGYVTNSDRGIRSHPYNTDMNVNSLTYSSARESANSSPHSTGTIWATILNEVYWNLVEEKKYGKLKDTKSGKGNVIFLQLMMDSLKIQPCNPDFVTARDAFLAADKDGAHKCTIWKGFAKRGLGYGADSNYKESYDVPPDCSK